MTASTVPWPRLDYHEWAATSDTLHGHLQVIGKLGVELAPPEPELQHAALELTARGWQTRALPAPDGSGAFTATVDLHRHETVLTHSDGRLRHVALTPHRSVGEVTREVLAAVADLAGSVRIDPTPQEVSWSVPLDRDGDHATYEPAQVATYFAAATRAAGVLSAFPAPYRGRSSPTNAWWGCMDLGTTLYSGRSATPQSDDFIKRNAADAESVEFGWWPGNQAYAGNVFYVRAVPTPRSFAETELVAGRWEPAIGTLVLDWEHVRVSDDPHATVLGFARTAFARAALLLEWDPALAASVDGDPPPIR